MDDEEASGATARAVDTLLLGDQCSRLGGLSRRADARVRTETGLARDRTRDLLCRLRKVNSSNGPELPANRPFLRVRCTSGWPRVRFRSGAAQTNQPTARTKKTCKRRPSGKRLKGFEPSTLCMASRTHAAPRLPNNPANEPFSHAQRHAAMPGIHQETMGVPGPKPDLSLVVPELPGDSRSCERGGARFGTHASEK
jgi:hypothetical protein